MLILSPFSINQIVTDKKIESQKVSASGTFQMQTGYYVGSGVAGLEISGLGFQPELVIIKSDTTAGVAMYKTSAMPAANSGYLGGVVDNTASQITFTSDGFTVGTLANINKVNIRYTWTAFYGSDCTVTGVFCVGQYTGNGVAGRTIDTGFQPDWVTTKRGNVSSSAVFRTSDYPVDRSSYYLGAVDITNGGGIQSFTSSGFVVGNAVSNLNAGIYSFFAFKEVANGFTVGTYTGNATDDRDITGVGFQPDMVMVKNSTNATAANLVPYMSNTHHFGDHSVGIGTTAATTVNIIQKLDTDGFQVGTSVFSNGTGDTYYYMTFGGVPDLPAGTETFTFARGSYVGTSVTQSITGIGFKPDLVVIKSHTTGGMVYRSSVIQGDSTANFAAASGNAASGITSLDVDGFTIGNIGLNATTNVNGVTYEWMAFGNAYNPYTRTGASDFAVGVYTSNGIDNRNINDIPFQPDFVYVHRSALPGVIKTSAHTGEVSSLSTTAADVATNEIQQLNSNGFQLGSGTNANGSTAVFTDWFAFKNSSNFTVGTYTGDGVDNRDINIGFQPDWVMIKRSTAVAGVHRSSNLVGDATQYFVGNQNTAGRIKSFIVNGFRLGTQAEVNANTGKYYYAAWKKPVTGSLDLGFVDAGGVSVINPSLTMSPVDYIGTYQSSSGTLGTSSEKMRVNNSTSTAPWTVSIAATSGSTALWDSGTHTYDFNDATPDAVDGGDTDSVGGRMTFDPTTATLTPQPGCTTTGVSMGSLAAFAESSQDSITLVSASGSAETNCYWDITGIGVNQTIPSGQSQGTYSLSMTATIVAY